MGPGCWGRTAPRGTCPRNRPESGQRRRRRRTRGAGRGQFGARRGFGCNRLAPDRGRVYSHPSYVLSISRGACRRPVVFQGDYAVTTRLHRSLLWAAIVAALAVTPALTL